MSLPTVRGERVAVIDDDADVLTAARMVLKRRFATVLPSNSPQALLDVMGQEPEFDALLLDMNFRRGDDSAFEPEELREMLRLGIESSLARLARLALLPLDDQHRSLDDQHR